MCCELATLLGRNTVLVAVQTGGAAVDSPEGSPEQKKTHQTVGFKQISDSYAQVDAVQKASCRLRAGSRYRVPTCLHTYVTEHTIKKNLRDQ